MDADRVFKIMTQALDPAAGDAESQNAWEMARRIPLPVNSKSVDAIYAYRIVTGDRKRPRRLSAAVIGQECPRATWFDFRWTDAEQFEGRMLRQFQTGHLEDSRFAFDLRGIGCEVHEVDPDTGRQFEFTACGGHLVVKLDAAVLGLPEAPKTWHAALVKTLPDESFRRLKNVGLKKFSSRHYAQLVVAMALSEMSRGYYFAADEDTDDIYSERLRWEDVKDEAAKLLAFAQDIIDSKEPPDKIGDSPEHPKCQSCCHRWRCHGDYVADVTCRTCLHSTPVTSGTLGIWRCERHKKNLSEIEQSKGCVDHLYIPQCVGYAEPQDSGDDSEGAWVSYRNRDGTEWKNGKQPNQYRSIELSLLPAPLVGAGTVETVKKEVGGEVVEFLECDIPY